jgi:hypothetical protein
MKKLLGITALAAFVALPAASFAQTFAYVNTSGEVTSMEATDAQTALMTAPNIATHSGVILLQSDDNGLVGDSVTVH